MQPVRCSNTFVFQPPILWDVLGFPYVCYYALLVNFIPKTSISGSFPQIQEAPVYFDREDVKRAIHAPITTHWTLCVDSVDEIFSNGTDESPLASLDVLPRVIEKSNRTVIIAGTADFVVLSTGYASQDLDNAFHLTFY